MAILLFARIYQYHFLNESNKSQNCLPSNKKYNKAQLLSHMVYNDRTNRSSFSYLYWKKTMQLISSIQNQLPGDYFTLLIDAITSWISAYGYAGVFLAMLIETIFPPIPSEVVLPLAGYAVFNNHGGIIDAIVVGIIAGLGSTVGATVIYLVVRKLGRYAVIKYGKYIFLDNKKLC